MRTLPASCYAARLKIQARLIKSSSCYIIKTESNIHLSPILKWNQNVFSKCVHFLTHSFLKKLGSFLGEESVPSSIYYLRRATPNIWLKNNCGELSLFSCVWWETRKCLGFLCIYDTWEILRKNEDDDYCMYMNTVEKQTI